MQRARRQGEDRVLTVPNGLTALRLACLPVFLVLLGQPHRRDLIVAACMLAAMGVTDGLDGYVARCPRHGWEFDIRTGETLFGIDKRRRARTFHVSVDSDDVVVELRRAQRNPDQASV